MLAPHAEMIERFAALLGIAKPHRAKPASASALSEGQRVRYRQGRGNFEATVVQVRSETNSVVIERLMDGKRVVRPATKVMPLS